MRSFPRSRSLFIDLCSILSVRFLTLPVLVNGSLDAVYVEEDEAIIVSTVLPRCGFLRTF